MRELQFDLGFIEPHLVNPLIVIALFGIPLLSMSFVKDGRDWAYEFVVLGLALSLTWVEATND